MQKRIFLSNRVIIQNAIRGLGNSTIYYDPSNSKPCEEYVLERKKEKAISKLYQFFENIENNFTNKRVFVKLLYNVKSCNCKNILIEFITRKFNTLNEIKNFFKSFN